MTQHLSARAAWCCLMGLAGPVGMAAGGAASVEALLEQSLAAHRKGQRQAAIDLASEAIRVGPADVRGYLMRAGLHERSNAYQKAVLDYDEAIRLMPTRADLYDRRGGARFKLGRIEASIADFDKAIELDPDREPEHWQRGISYYYAGRYKDGWKQFDVHQTVNPNDVENSVWRFLCMTRAVGVERARKEMLEIRGDRRIPMTEVLALFGGKGTVDAVLAAAVADDPSPQRRRQQLFYAHLYIGLFYEATGKAALAREHIGRAARAFTVDHYMGDVARVHAAMFEKAAALKRDRAAVSKSEKSEK